MISDISPVNNYSGNGSATTFDFDFYIEDSSQLKVYKINSSGATIQLSEDIDYSVNSFTDDFSNGGYITFPLSLSTHDILSSDEKISLQLDIPFEQESEFGNSSLLNLNSLEFSLDYLTRLCQILKRQVARCAKIKEAVDVDPDSLSENINLLAEIKNDISTVSNAIDDVIVTSSNTENISSVAGSIENVNAVADDLENIDAVNDNKTNIDTVAGSISDVNTVAGSIQDVNTVAGSIADINDVADDLTNIDSVAGDLTNIDSVAGDLTNIDSVAGDLTNIDSVNSNKTNINTVAGSIANVNSVADSISNVNSVAGNISNVNAVKNNETNINAVNSNKTNIDTVAGSIANINTTAGSIANVNTVAGSIQDINNVADDLTKINLVAGDLLNIDSASDYADNANVWAEGTDADVQELGGVHSAKGWAEVAASGQIQSDWSQSDNTQKDFIKNKPTIPAAQIQSDWTQNDSTALDYIKNKPTIPDATDVKINSTSITSDGVANIVTNSAYDASSNKIATMSDLPADEIFVATYGVTTASKILTAFQAGKVIFCKNGYEYSILFSYEYNTFYFVSPYNKGVNVYGVNAQTGWSSSLNQFVTHGNLPVGDSTIPVYISSSGVATSTGLSIASSRFDGQFVARTSATQIASDLTPTSVQQLNISSYLPNDSNNYDVYLSVSVFTKTTSGHSICCIIGSDLLSFTSSNSDIGIKVAQARTRTSSNMTAAGTCIVPVGTGRKIYVFAPTDFTNGTINIWINGYRRIGTNS